MVITLKDIRSINKKYFKEISLNNNFLWNVLTQEEKENHDFKILKMTNGLTVKSTLSFMQKEPFPQNFNQSTHWFFTVIEVRDEFVPILELNKKDLEPLAKVLDERKPMIIQWESIDSNKCLIFFRQPHKPFTLLEVNTKESLMEEILIHQSFQLPLLLELFRQGFGGLFNEDLTKVNFYLDYKFKKHSLLNYAAHCNDSLSLRFLLLNSLWKDEDIRKALKISIKFSNLESLSALLDLPMTSTTENPFPSGQQKNLLALAIDLVWSKKYYDFVLDLLKVDAPFPAKFNLDSLPKDKDVVELNKLVEERQAFHLDLKNGSLDAVQKFIENHPRLKKVYNPSNQSAMTTASKAGQYKMYELLQSKGFFTTEKDRQSFIGNLYKVYNSILRLDNNRLFGHDMVNSKGIELLISVSPKMTILNLFQSFINRMSILEIRSNFIFYLINHFRHEEMFENLKISINSKLIIDCSCYNEEIYLERLLIFIRENKMSVFFIADSNTHQSILYKLNEFNLFPRKTIDYSYVIELEQNLLLAKDEYGQTVWHLAAMKGDIESLNKMIMCFEDEFELDTGTYNIIVLKENLLTSEDDNKQTAWHLAVVHDRVNVLEKLSEFVNLNLELTTSELNLINELFIRKDNNGKTAWHLAVVYGYEDVLDALFEFIKNLDIELTTLNSDLINELVFRKDNNEQSVWHLAVVHDRVSVLDALFVFIKNLDIELTTLKSDLINELLIRKDNNKQTVKDLAVVHNRVSILDSLFEFIENLGIELTTLKSDFINELSVSKDNNKQTVLESTAPELNSSGELIDVPSDNSCLFWAAAVAYLIPVGNDETTLKKRCEHLFGDHMSIDIKYIKDWLQDLQLKDHPSSIIKELVTEKFRGRVVDQLALQENLKETVTLNDFVESKNRNFIVNGEFLKEFCKEFSCDFNTPQYGKLNNIEVIDKWLSENPNAEQVQKFKFDQYLAQMRKPTSWGGNHELLAISQLLKCSIKVSSRDSSYISDFSPNSDNNVVQLCLFKNDDHYQCLLKEAAPPYKKTQDKPSQVRLTSSKEKDFSIQTEKSANDTEEAKIKFGEIHDYVFNRISLCIDVEKNDHYYKITRFLYNRNSNSNNNPGNHTIPLSTFLSILKSILIGGDCLHKINRILSCKFLPFSIKNDEKIFNYVRGEFKKIRNSSAAEVERFLQKICIPFVFYEWDKRLTANYYLIKSRSDLGKEGGFVRILNNLLTKVTSKNEIPKDLKSFKGSMENIRDKFLKSIDLPVFITKGRRNIKENERLNFFRDITLYLARKHRVDDTKISKNKIDIKKIKDVVEKILVRLNSKKNNNPHQEYINALKSINAKNLECVDFDYIEKEYLEIILHEARSTLKTYITAIELKEIFTYQNENEYPEYLNLFFSKQNFCSRMIDVNNDKFDPSRKNEIISMFSKSSEEGNTFTYSLNEEQEQEQEQEHSNECNQNTSNNMHFNLSLKEFILCEYKSPELEIYNAFNLRIIFTEKWSVDTVFFINNKENDKIVKDILEKHAHLLIKDEQVEQVEPKEYIYIIINGTSENYVDKSCIIILEREKIIEIPVVYCSKNTYIKLISNSILKCIPELGLFNERLNIAYFINILLKINKPCTDYLRDSYIDEVELIENQNEKMKTEDYIKQHIVCNIKTINEYLIGDKNILNCNNDLHILLKKSSIIISEPLISWYVKYLNFISPNKFNEIINLLNLIPINEYLNINKEKLNTYLINGISIYDCFTEIFNKNMQNTRKRTRESTGYETKKPDEKKQDLKLSPQKNTETSISTIIQKVASIATNGTSTSAARRTVHEPLSSRRSPDKIIQSIGSTLNINDSTSKLNS